MPQSKNKKKEKIPFTKIDVNFITFIKMNLSDTHLVEYMFKVTPYFLVHEFQFEFALFRKIFS